MIVKIKNVTIEVIQSDLLQTQADAFVCPMNVKLNMWYGIAKVVRDQGGDEFEAEVKSKKTPELGMVITVKGGVLPVKYVFCAVIEDELHDVKREVVSTALHHCFRLMSAMSLKKLAIPMFGSPRAKIPYDTFSRLMIRSTFEFFTGEECAADADGTHIVFALYNKEMFTSFCSQMDIIRQEYFV